MKVLQNALYVVLYLETTTAYEYAVMAVIHGLILNVRAKGHYTGELLMSYL